MATKTLITRIKNKVDTYANWEGTTGLLDGEIAIVRVTTEEVTPAGDVVKVPALLMKVGDGTSTFDALPWLSAKASDVYDWAKKGTIEEVPVTVNNTASTLGAYLAKVDTNASNISKNTEAIETLNGSDTKAGSVAKAIKDAIEALDANSEQGTGNIVKAVTQVNGKITVTKGTIAESDLPGHTHVRADITDFAHNHNDIYYTETEVNALLAEKSDKNHKHDNDYASKTHDHDDRYYTEQEVDDLINEAVSSVLEYKGTKATLNDLPTEGNETGDVWNITNAGTLNGVTVSAGDNVAWNGTGWDVLAGTVDLSNYYNKSEVNALLDEKAEKEHTHNYAGSASVGGPANSVKASLTFNNSGNGDESGAAFDGSTAKIISYNTIGAAAAGHKHVKADITDFAHNHDDRYYTETEVNALLDEKADKEHSHTITAGAEDDDVVVLEGTSGTDGVSYKATHAASGVTAGTYKSVTVNAKGHVTAGTNPTTIAGFGITDAYTKDEVNAELAKCVTVADNKMYFGSDVIIFDCGGAEDL